jgi:hypothetical protein
MFKPEWNEGWRWLLLEGIMPLFGAGVIYLLFGVARYVASSKKPRFAFAWVEAVDTLGWLYGAAIIAAQSGWRSVHLHAPVIWTVTCFVTGGLSLIQLLAAMVNRGEDPAWRPPVPLKVFSGFLAAVILYAGYNINMVVTAGGH